MLWRTLVDVVGLIFAIEGRLIPALQEQPWQVWFGVHLAWLSWSAAAILLPYAAAKVWPRKE